MMRRLLLLVVVLATACSPKSIPENTPSAQRSAPAGVQSRPRLGSYIFDLDGETNHPSQPGPYPPGQRVRIQISGDGDRYTSALTEESGQGPSQTLTSQWGDRAVRLVSVGIDFGRQKRRCVLDEPITILAVPIRTAKLAGPRATGKDCSVQIVTEILGKENVEASGRNWETWKIEATSEFNFGPALSIKSTSSAWFAPELGSSVRKESTDVVSERGREVRSVNRLTLVSFPEP